MFLQYASRSRPIALLAGPRLAALRSSPLLVMAPARRKNATSVPEGYKEDHSKGNLYRFEDSLPKLPVPTLEETTKRYLRSVKPLISESEFANTKAAVEKFVKPGGIGETLQKRLLARRDDPKHKNWLYEWWNSAAYLKDTGPVVPYVSYFYSYRDDRKRRDPAKRAAAITTAVLDFKRQADDGSLEPEYMRKQPISMESYQWMFNACRVPGKVEDYAVKFPYKEHPYIVVVRKNQFFKVMHEVDGKQLNTAELEKQFRYIYQHAEKAPAVGALTSERRRVWAEMRERLLAANPQNKVTLEVIEASSFIVNLDDAAPVTLAERAHQFWHGDGANRWYDKPCQFVINDNGTAGFMGEHGFMDGTPTHRLSDYTNKMIFTNALDFSATEIRSTIPDPVPLRFVLNAAVQKDIATAQAGFATTIAEHDLVVEAYQGYGKGLIKKFKCSPDAFVQMLIQLAYHKMYGKNRPTYESAATRKFQQGRTETCRSVSVESVAFCDAMADSTVSNEKLIELFRAAIKAHVQYIADASEGRGVDRHLFGLKNLVQEGEQIPDVFIDPAYSYSSSWYVSSSQLSSEYFNGYGWSQVIDDGWGIAYMINENSINFNIVSKGLGNARMAFYLNEAAEALRELLTPTLEPPKAKL